MPVARGVGGGFFLLAESESEMTLDTKALMVWTYQGVSVYFDPIADMGNLTAMYQACGSPDNKAPTQWLRLPQTVKFIEAAMEKYDMEKSHIVVSERGGLGGGGGTWAHWQITVAYAHYLDEAFYLWWNEQARAYLEGVGKNMSDVLAYLVNWFGDVEAYGRDGKNLALALFKFVKEVPASLNHTVQITSAVLSEQVCDPLRTGRVYVLCEIGTSPPVYKIGETSKTVEERCKKIAEQTSVTHEVIKEIETTDRALLERKIQRFYKRYQIKPRSELFHLGETEVKMIRALPDFLDAKLFDASDYLTPDKLEAGDLFVGLMN